MKLNRRQLIEGKKEIMEEDVDFSQYPFNDSHVRAIPFCHVQIEATDYGSTLRIIFHIDCEVTAVCSYTLQDVPLQYHFTDELEFCDEEEEVGNLIYEPSNLIDLNPHILSLIFARVPIKVIKKGAKLPQSGDGYTVISEDEYYQKRQQEQRSVWDVLDTVKLDDSDK